MDLDHHSIWIITRSGSSLGQHHWCYLIILLVTGSSIEPALFHAGCRPSPHVGLPQHLYLAYSSERHSTHIHSGWNTSCSQWWKSSALPSRLEHILLTMMEYFPTFIQARTHPAHNDEILSSRLEHILFTMMKYFYTYIHPGGNTSCSQWWKGLHLHPSRREHILLIVMEGLALISDLVGANPIVISE